MSISSFLAISWPFCVMCIRRSVGGLLMCCLRLELFHLPVLIYLWNILIKMYFCFYCVCVFYSMCAFTSGSDSLNEDVFMHTSRVDCLVMPLFKKCKNGTLPSHLPHRSLKGLWYWIRELLLSHQETCRSRSEPGFLGRRHPPHKCEWIMPIERQEPLLLHETSYKALVTFFQRISVSNYFYLAAAIKDLPLLSFSLFLHLFHHLSHHFFFYKVPLLIPEWISILWKERFRCIFVVFFPFISFL